MIYIDNCFECKTRTTIYAYVLGKPVCEACSPELHCRKCDKVTPREKLNSEEWCERCVKSFVKNVQLLTESYR